MALLGGLAGLAIAATLYKFAPGVGVRAPMAVPMPMPEPEPEAEPEPERDGSAIEGAAAARGARALRARSFGAGASLEGGATPRSSVAQALAPALVSSAMPVVVASSPAGQDLPPACGSSPVRETKTSEQPDPESSATTRRWRRLHE